VLTVEKIDKTDSGERIVQMTDTAWLNSSENRETFAAKDSPTGKGWSKLKGCRILIIEDEALEALLTAQTITEFGAEVVGVATSIPGALAEISTKDFDCVVLDVNMGGMFSLGMARGLKDMGIPFIFCTAYGHIIEEFAEAPIVEKPFTEATLAAGLLEALGRKAGKR